MNQGCLVWMSMVFTGKDFVNNPLVIIVFLLKIQSRQAYNSNDNLKNHHFVPY